MSSRVSTMLSDQALEHMTREELVEHVRRMQEELLDRAEELEEASEAESQRQRFTVAVKTFCRTSDSTESHYSRNPRKFFSPHENRNNNSSQLLQTHTSTGEETQLGNINYDETVSMTSSAGVLDSTQGSAVSFVNLKSIPTQKMPKGHAWRSISGSISSLGYQAPVKTTEKVCVIRNDDGVKCINHYQVIKEIGRGSCGKVQLAYDFESENLVAIKQVRRADTKLQVGGQTVAQMQYSALQREIAVMKKLRHKNIIPLYEVIDDVDAKRLYLVMMYVNRGPIARIQFHSQMSPDAEVCTPIPAPKLALYIRQILSGLEYLHRHKVVHRDIKPENILVDKDGHAFLADFGMAEFFDVSNRGRLEQMMQESMAASKTFGVHGQGEGSTIRGTKGTMLFIAPELWRGDRSFAKPVDMWAMGVTLYILLTGKLPFCTLDDIMDPSLPQIPTSYGKEWAMLLRGMLHRNPNERMTAQEGRLIVKFIIKTNLDSNVLSTDEQFHVSEDEVAHALTPAQTQNDQEDVCWHSEGQQSCMNADELPLLHMSHGMETSINTNYDMPYVMSNSETRAFPSVHTFQSCEKVASVVEKPRKTVQTEDCSSEDPPLREPSDVFGESDTVDMVDVKRSSWCSDQLSNKKKVTVERDRKGKGGIIAHLRDALAFTRKR